MPRTGPLTKDTSTIALGLAQIRVGPSVANIASINSVLSSDASLGALANTKLISDIEYWTLESGFPMLEDTTLALREKASLECSFKEITPYNLALAHGEDPVGYTDVHSGEIALGTVSNPTYVRMEAIYTFPDNNYEMHAIFPRAQAISVMEIDLQGEDAAAVAVTFKSNRADSGIAGGDAAWDDMPLGRIEFVDNSV